MDILTRDIPVPDTPSGSSIMAQEWFWPLMAALAVTAGIAIVMQVLGIKPKVLLAFGLAIAAAVLVTLIVANN